MQWDALRRDLAANPDPISKLIVTIYRFGNWIHYSVKIIGIRQLLWAIYRLFDIVVLRIIGGGTLNAKVQIGGGLRLPHGVNGLIVFPRTVIGENVTLMHQVTLGKNFGKHSPVIGNGVFIGPGAKVLGDISIGDGARIGANAVVLIDVPARTTAVGVPARLIARRPVGAKSYGEMAEETPPVRMNADS